VEIRTHDLRRGLVILIIKKEEDIFGFLVERRWGSALSILLKTTCEHPF